MTQKEVSARAVPSPKGRYISVGVKNEGWWTSWYRQTGCVIVVSP